MSLYIHCFMSDIRYGVPYEQFVDVFNGNDIDYEYRWFVNRDDAIAYARTLGDIGWDPINMIIECGGVKPDGFVSQ